MRDMMPEIGSFVALGDSFTEGLGDPYADGTGYQGLGYSAWTAAGPTGSPSGWPLASPAGCATRTSRFAASWWGRSPPSRCRWPSLWRLTWSASRRAATTCCGRGPTPTRSPQAFDAAVADLRGAGSEVLVFTGFDTRAFPLVRLIRGKAAAYNMHLRAIADRHDCYLVDLWSMRVLDDPREWSQDRLHMSPDGHRRVALRACEVMGVSVDEDWRDPLPPRIDEDATAKAAKSRAARLSQTTDWLAARRLDARWAREYAVPWFSRRLRGVSSGDGIPPKRPEMLPL